MDYLELLHLAQRNSRRNESKEVRCYSTRFSPPKKDVKKKVSEENIKRYFEQCEDTIKQKLKEEERKKHELFALRAQDKKIQARCQRMLKNTKSAQRSVIDDSTENTRSGSPLQGYDDFGYVSQEASILYEKLLSKYQSCENESTGKINLPGVQRKEVDLKKAKDRVRIALKMEEEGLIINRKEKNKPQTSDYNMREENKNEDHTKSNKKSTKMRQMRVNSNKDKHAPLNFQQLLEIAEKNQYEPLAMERSGDSPEKLMTKKQKTEERKLMRSKTPQSQAIFSDNNRINELSKKIGGEKMCKKRLMKNSNANEEISNELSTRNQAAAKQSGNKGNKFSYSRKTSPLNLPVSGKNKLTNINDEIMKIDREVDYLLKKKAELMMNLHVQKNATSNIKERKIPSRRESNSFEAKGVKHLELNPKKNNEKRRIINYDSFEAKGGKNLELHPKKNNVKRRIIHSDSEYDSDLNDFIVDDEDNDHTDLSNHIKEIFGYDKTQYIGMEEEECLESSFQTELQEEKRSARIGLLEDLADIQLEKKMRMAAKRKKQERK